MRIYGEALSADEIAELATPPEGGSDDGGGGGGASGDVGYVEAFETWIPDSRDTWETVDLAAFGVPADAVAEIAVRNDDTGNQRWGGVRAVGSSLDRRLRLHEAESGGLDVVVMHVQVDADGRIEVYSDDPSDVTFALLGYWTGAAYEERFDAFEAGRSGSWIEHSLAAYGVAAGQVAELALSNTSTSRERLAGTRAMGSSLSRRFDLQEAESGGVDAASLMVVASNDGKAAIEVYAESDSDVDFHLLGFWTTPPGTYTEASADLGQPASSQSWDTLDSREPRRAGQRRGPARALQRGHRSRGGARRASDRRGEPVASARPARSGVGGRGRRHAARRDGRELGDPGVRRRPGAQPRFHLARVVGTLRALTPPPVGPPRPGFARPPGTLPDSVRVSQRRLTFGGFAVAKP